MWGKLTELNLFDTNSKITIKKATPAQMLQQILEASWTLADDDKDMTVMYHKIGYILNGNKKQIDANMVVVGENRSHTAMAKTVGLPVAMATLLILNGHVRKTGVQIPIHKEVYEPVLSELKTCGVVFREYEVPYMGYNPDSVAG
jgi:saccharopine dehydrogenase-like NADP-dependent oxidoreductase